MEVTVQVHNVGAMGIIGDVPSHLLPPEAWTAGMNMVFDQKGATSALGQARVFPSSPIGSGFIFQVPSLSNAYWLHGNLAKMYVYDNGVHVNITRQSIGVDVDYNATAFADWQGTILGGVPVLNNEVDVPQFWATLTSGQKLQDLTNWPSNLRAKVVKAFGRYLLAMNITEGGSSFPHVVRWSHEADPGTIPTSWDITNPAVDASQLELTDVEGGVIVDGLMLGDAFVVYKQTSTHTLRRINDRNIFKPDLILASSGVMSKNCVGLIKKGTQHFVVTEDDIVVHAGGKDAKSIIDARNRNRLFDDIDPNQRDKTHVLVIDKLGQAGVAYCSVGATTPDRLALYDYNRDHWTFRSYVGTSAASGVISLASFPNWNVITQNWSQITTPWSQDAGRGVVVADPGTGTFHQISVGDTWEPVAELPYLERMGLAIIGRDRQGQPKVDYRIRKLIHRVWPKISGTTPVNVQVGMQEALNAPVTWSPPALFDPSTDLYVDIDPPMNGRLPAVRFTAQEHGPWQLEGYDLDMSLLGNL